MKSAAAKSARSRLRNLIAGALLASSVAVGATAPSTSTPANASSHVSDCVIQRVNWINEARTDAGVPTVYRRSSSGACYQSRQQALRDRMFHSNNYPRCGEIVGWTSGRPGLLPQMWLDSPPHYEVIVWRGAKSAAIGYVQNLNSGRWYGTAYLCP